MKRTPNRFNRMKKKIILDLDELVGEKIWQDTDATTGKKFWICSVCNYSQKLRKDVMKHVERRHMNLAIPCQYCPASLPSRTELRTHIKAKHAIDINFQYVA